MVPAACADYYYSPDYHRLARAGPEGNAQRGRLDARGARLSGVGGKDAERAGAARGLRPAGDAELAEDRPDVVSDAIGGQPELPVDPLVRMRRETLEDRHLVARERRRGRGPAAGADGEEALGGRRQDRIGGLLEGHCQSNWYRTGEIF